MKPNAGDNVMNFGDLSFYELEGKFGFESARQIVRTLEQLEGISESGVVKLSYVDRLRNVLSSMSDNLLYETRH